MGILSDQQDQVYDVVINDEEQYSIWLAHRDLPPGWRRVGRRGTKEECLDFIEVTWTDMRPLSLRLRMAGSHTEPGSQATDIVS
ncbi:MbtH family NRPS accessory protein [Nocardia gipuzkoensis]|nr:MbtH family NRPS accessory protein [Nocardia gipuzkoensis]